MLWMGGFYLEDEQERLHLDERNEIIDFPSNWKEIRSGLTSKFYDDNKHVDPLEDQSSFTPQEENMHLRFRSQPKPWFPLPLRDKLEKLRKGTIERDEMTDLIRKIAEISIDFYNIEAERFIAVRFDGRIVEDADSETELLLKVQGRRYGMPVFVWHVGYESFLGWRT